jgi:ubiquinone/menaquinone biosynthesis C-methylase UbiE
MWDIVLMYTDAARFYDLIHDALGRDPDAEADVFITEIRRRCASARTLLDVACGTGANLPRFAESFTVEGLDTSDEMLALAQERCPEVPFVRADMRSFNLGRRFDAVVSLFSGIGYLTEEPDLRQAIFTMAAHLNPGGVLMLEGWIEPDQWLGSSVSAGSCQTNEIAVARVAKSSAEGMRSVFSARYTAATNEGFVTVDEHHVMRFSDPIEFANAYDHAGLSFERLPHLLRPGRAAYVGIAP